VRAVAATGDGGGGSGGSMVGQWPPDPAQRLLATSHPHPPAAAAAQPWQMLAPSQLSCAADASEPPPAAKRARLDGSGLAGEVGVTASGVVAEVELAARGPCCSEGAVRSGGPGLNV
jgi:hypothetical protein